MLRRLRKRRGPAPHGRPEWSTRAGSLLLDALLSVAIFGVIVGAFSSGISGGQQGTLRGGNRTRAAYLAEEALEAVRSIRDKVNGFTTISDPLIQDQDKGVQLVGSDWTIASSPTTIDNLFTRKVVFSAGPDANTRKVTSTVSWTEIPGNQLISVSVESYLTNWQSIPAPPVPDWKIPTIIRSAFIDDATFEKVEVSGNYAYIADSSGSYGVLRYDISNLGSPLPAPTSVSGIGVAFDIAINGVYAYVGTGDAANELKILNISGVPTITRQINLTGIGNITSISITGTGLFVTKVQNTGPELYVFDIGEDPSLATLSSPPVLSDSATEAVYESDTLGTDSMYAATGAGNDVKALYAYIATGTSNHQELSVISSTGSILTGNANAAINVRGTAIAIFNTGALIGVTGGDMCEIFAIDIAGKIENPNMTADCSNHGHDIGDDASTPHTVNDLVANSSLKLLFSEVEAWRSSVKHFLQIIDISNVHNINSPRATKTLYEGTILNLYGCDFGASCLGGEFYRESDHTLFMVLGSDMFSPGSHLVVLQPTYN